MDGIGCAANRRLHPTHALTGRTPLLHWVGLGWVATDRYLSLAVMMAGWICEGEFEQELTAGCATATTAAIPGKLCYVRHTRPRSCCTPRTVPRIVRGVEYITSSVGSHVAGLPLCSKIGGRAEASIWLMVVIAGILSTGGLH